MATFDFLGLGTPGTAATPAANPTVTTTGAARSPAPTAAPSAATGPARKSPVTATRSSPAPPASRSSTSTTSAHAQQQPQQYLVDDSDPDADDDEEANEAELQRRRKRLMAKRSSRGSGTGAGSTGSTTGDSGSSTPKAASIASRATVAVTAVTNGSTPMFSGPTKNVIDMPSSFNFSGTPDGGDAALKFTPVRLTASDNDVGNDPARYFELISADARSRADNTLDYDDDEDDDDDYDEAANGNIGPDGYELSPEAQRARRAARLARRQDRQRQFWIDQQLELREYEYTTIKTVRVFLGTWNVNAKKAHQERDLSAWLLPPDELSTDDEDDDDANESSTTRSGGSSRGSRGASEQFDDNPFEAPSSADGLSTSPQTHHHSAHSAAHSSATRPRRGTPADIYAVGFQEIVDLTAANLVVDHNASGPWEAHILKTLRSSGKPFTQIATVHLVGLSLALFVRDKYLSAIHDVRVSNVATGIMGVGGNKGAVLIHFNMYKSSICIVNSHLAAHKSKVALRNRDYHSILKRALLVDPSSSHRKRAYTDTTNKLKLQPWVAGGGGDDEDDDDDDFDEGGGGGGGSGASSPPPSTSSNNLSRSNSSAAISASSASSSSSSSSSSSATTSSSSSIKSSLNVARMKELMAASKDIMSAGLDTLKKGIRATIQQNLGDGDARSARTGLHLYDHDHIFWMGDLNYRLNMTDLDEISRLIRQKNWPALLKHDQLLIERKRGHAFVGFHEGEIKFAPTYKYQTGTNRYDRREDKKVRIPSYCDRVLWCTNDEEDFQQLMYRRAELLASDHKPVMSAFIVPMKKDMVNRKAKLQDELVKLTRDPRKCMPQLAFTDTSVDLGEVRFEVPVVRSVSFKNVGSSVLTFRCEHEGLRGKLRVRGDSPLIAPWMSVDPVEGVVHPGEVMTLTITVFVDRKNAYLLNSDELTVALPLAVRLTSRHRAMLTFKGRYLKSCLGAELTWLLAQPRPVRAHGTHNDGRQNGRDGRPQVAYELYRLVDHVIKANGCATKGTFYPPPYDVAEDTSGTPNAKPYATLLATPQVRYICEQLDTGREFDQPATATTRATKLATHHFVQAMLYFLHSLQRPVFYKRYKLLSQMTAKERELERRERADREGGGGMSSVDLTAWCMQTLNELSADNYRTFMFIASFLREALKHKSAHGVGAEELALCFAGSLMQKLPDEPFNDRVPYTPTQILEHILTSREFAAHRV